ncbi:MAG: hypothetical protein GX610_05730 [Rhodococcus sp.]|nr:hypothetical protein [Rhodococcus sp. (in: high G+C Gram-positive bacteria)]
MFDIGDLVKLEGSELHQIPNSRPDTPFLRCAGVEMEVFEVTALPHRHPISRRASTLLNRGDVLLSDSASAETPADRFHGAYLAALRGAGAVLAAAEGVGGMAVKAGRSRNAWLLMARAAPEFEGWSEYFAGWSQTRVAIEAGVSATLGEEDANAFRANVGDFLHSIEDYLGIAGRLDLRAS